MFEKLTCTGCHGCFPQDPEASQEAIFTSEVSCTHYLLKRVLSVAPLERVDDAVVDPHGDGAAHDGQGGRGDHGDDAQLEQRQQAHHQPSQHHACPLRVLPVDQVHHWRTAKRAGDSVDTVKIL